MSVSVNSSSDGPVGGWVDERGEGIGRWVGGRVYEGCSFGSVRGGREGQSVSACGGGGSERREEMLQELVLFQVL